MTIIGTRCSVTAAITVPTASLSSSFGRRVHAMFACFVVVWFFAEEATRATFISLDMGHISVN